MSQGRRFGFFSAVIAFDLLVLLWSIHKRAKLECSHRFPSSSPPKQPFRMNTSGSVTLHFAKPRILLISTTHSNLLNFFFQYHHVVQSSSFHCRLYRNSIDETVNIQHIFEELSKRKAYDMLVWLNNHIDLQLFERAVKPLEMQTCLRVIVHKCGTLLSVRACSMAPECFQSVSKMGLSNLDQNFKLKNISISGVAWLMLGNTTCLHDENE